MNGFMLFLLGAMLFILVAVMLSIIYLSVITGVLSYE